MLTDIKPDILFILGHTEPDSAINNRANDIGHNKCIPEGSKCRNRVYQEPGGIPSINPENPPITAAAKKPVASVPHNPPIP